MLSLVSFYALLFPVFKYFCVYGTSETRVPGATNSQNFLFFLKKRTSFLKSFLRVREALGLILMSSRFCASCGERR